MINDDDDFATKMPQKSISCGPMFLSLGGCNSSSDRTRTCHRTEDSNLTLTLYSGVALLYSVASFTPSQVSFQCFWCCLIVPAADIEVMVHCSMVSFSLALGEHLSRLSVPLIISQLSRLK